MTCLKIVFYLAVCMVNLNFALAVPFGAIPMLNRDFRRAAAAQVKLL